MIDLTGQRFGKLVVIQQGKYHIQKSGKKLITWKCKCDCGNVKEIEGSALRRGKSKSCGCSQNDYRSKFGQLKRKDEIGNKYGRLTVIKETGERSAGSLVYECKCDCGNTTVVRATSLRDGSVRSCGCLQKEKAKLSQKTNAKIGNYKGTRIPSLNETLYKSNTTGVRGVYKFGEKYMAMIGIQKEMKYLGLYKDIDDARKARQTAEDELWQPLIDEYNENEVRH
jgi:hypothetical protein